MAFNMYELAVVNLDCLLPEELQAWNASLLSVDVPPQVRVDYQRYVDGLVLAQAFRLGGAVHAAQVHERKCDHIYRQLPAAWRW